PGPAAALSRYISPTRPPLYYTLFPYTTLFRSTEANGLQAGQHMVVRRRDRLHEPGERAEPAFRIGRDIGMASGVEQHVALRMPRSEEHTSELQSRENLVCRLLLEKKKTN